MAEEKVRDREHHERLFKASLNPLRRKIVASIGVFGKKKDELRSELDLTDFQLKFNLEYLEKEGFIVAEGDLLKLTDDGVELLEAG